MQPFEANIFKGPLLPITIASLPTTQKHFDLTVLLMRQQKLNYSLVVFVPCLNSLAQTKKKESDNLQLPKASNPKDRKICQLCFILQFLQLKCHEGHCPQYFFNYFTFNNRVHYLKDYFSDSLEGNVHQLTRVSHSKKTQESASLIGTFNEVTMKQYVLFATRKQVNLTQAFKNKSPLKIQGVKPTASKPFHITTEEYAISNKQKLHLLHWNLNSVNNLLLNYALLMKPLPKIFMRPWI